MAVFVMQTMGCDVAALNTVQFSMQTQAIDLESLSPLLSRCYLLFSLTEYTTGNHTGYKQFEGTKTSAEEISRLYAGLKQSYLTDFDVMLTGYAPSAEAVDAIGAIARDLKLRSSTKPGSFFWGLWCPMKYLQIQVTQNRQYSILSWATKDDSTLVRTWYPCTETCCGTPI